MARFVSVQWPWPNVQHRGGRMRGGNLYAVAAGTGVGKTTFILNGLRSWARQGICSTVFSTEMPAWELFVRVAAANLGYDFELAINRCWADLGAGSRRRLLTEYRRLRGGPMSAVRWMPQMHPTVGDIVVGMRGTASAGYGRATRARAS